MEEQNNEFVSHSGGTSVESSLSSNTIDTSETCASDGENYNITTQTKDKMLKELENTQVSIKDQKEYVNDLRNQFKEQKALARSNYDEIKNTMPKKFVIRNKRTKRILEVQAVNSCHASQLVGWRMRHTIVLSEQDIVQTDNRTDVEVKLQGV